MTIENSLENRTIGEIAATLPGAAAVFRTLKLDFCCGGDAMLVDAVRERGLDIRLVERTLATLDSSKSAPAPQATGALIDHILMRYRETHRRELPELVRLARKVEAIHASHPDAPHGLADTIQAELQKHMQQEETELFPLMRQPHDARGALPIAHCVTIMIDMASFLRRLEALALPGGACRSWEALYVGTDKLIDDVMKHIHLENVLFPRFENREAA